MKFNLPLDAQDGRRLTTSVTEKVIKTHRRTAGSGRAAGESWQNRVGLSGPAPTHRHL